MLLRNELQQYDFYRKSLSLFMKHTPSLNIRCDMWTAILRNVLSCADGIFDLLNIFYYNSKTDNYLTSIGYDLNGTAKNFLDEIALIYGISRQVVLTENYDKDKHSIPVADRQIKQITLTNQELLILIEATIRKYNFNGTRQGIREIYQGTPLFQWIKYQTGYPEEIQKYIQYIKTSSFLTTLNIIYYDSGSAKCTIAIDSSDTTATANIMNLFTNGLLTIESVGIEYEYVDSKQFEFAKFDTATFYQPGVTPYYIFADNAPSEV